MLETEAPLPEQFATQEALKQTIHQLISKLPAQQQEVLTLRFGLKDGQALTLAEIGRRLSISRERVRQIQKEAMKHLQLQKACIQDYLAS